MCSQRLGQYHIDLTATINFLYFVLGFESKLCFGSKSHVPNCSLMDDEKTLQLVFLTSNKWRLISRQSITRIMNELPALFLAKRGLFRANDFHKDQIF